MKKCDKCRFKEKSMCTKDYESPITTPSILVIASCYNARHSECYCGAEGKYFEEIESKPLRIEIFHGTLNVVYGIDQLLTISAVGRLCTFQSASSIFAYQKWREGKREVNTCVICWRGAGYQLTNSKIDSVYLIRADLSDGGEIYDFNRCLASVGCKDYNILRHPHNARPI